MRLRATPDRGHAVRLERHEIDRIARAVADGRRGLGARLDAFADAIAARMTAKLAAAGVRTSRRTVRRSRVTFDRETQSLIVARVSKHLPTAADATGHGSARTR